MIGKGYKKGVPLRDALTFLDISLILLVVLVLAGAQPLDLP